MHATIFLQPFRCCFFFSAANSLQKPDARKGDWRYMGALVMSQRWLVLTSLATLVLAAGCAIAVPHYSSRALNAAAFAQDKVVRANRKAPTVV